MEATKSTDSILNELRGNINNLTIAPSPAGLDASNSSNEPNEKKLPAKPSITKRTFDSVLTEIKALVAINHMRNDGRPAEILPGLYLGSVGAALSKRVLLELEITHVLSVMDKMKTPYPNDFEYKQIEIYDSVDDDIQKHFVNSTEYIHNVLTNKGKILVHCFAGKSRSSTIVCSYLMKYNKMKRDAALEHIRQKRPIICPNLGFMKQLLEWEKLLFPNSLIQKEENDESKLSSNDNI